MNIFEPYESPMSPKTTTFNPQRATLDPNLCESLKKIAKISVDIKQLHEIPIIPRRNSRTVKNSANRNRVLQPITISRPKFNFSFTLTRPGTANNAFIKNSMNGKITAENKYKMNSVISRSPGKISVRHTSRRCAKISFSDYMKIQEKKRNLSRINERNKENISMQRIPKRLDLLLCENTTEKPRNLMKSITNVRVKKILISTAKNIHNLNRQFRTQNWLEKSLY